MLTAISSGVTAPISKPIGACTRERAFRRHGFLEEYIVNPLDLGFAADEADVLQIPRGQCAESIQIVSVSARHDHGVGIGGEVGAVQPVGMLSTTTSSASGKRSRFANFSRSSST